MCQLSLTDLTPSTAYGGPPPLSGEAINRDFFKFCKVYFQGSPEKGAGKPQCLTEGFLNTSAKLTPQFLIPHY